MTIDEAEKIKTVVENKDYIVQLVNTVAKTMIEAFENLKIEDVNMFQLGYNKAIDDFTEKAIKIVYESNNREINPQPRDMVADIHYKLLEIAEQLKAGESEWTNVKVVFTIKNIQIC